MTNEIIQALMAYREGKVKVDLNNYINNFLPHNISDNFRTLDGKDVAQWLERQGYTVIGFYNTGRNGLATTEQGFKVSTSGWVTR